MDGRINFFFISSSSTWSFSSCWGDPRIEPNKHNRIDVIDREDFLRLRDIKVLAQRELMTKQALYDAGLSLITFLGIAKLVSHFIFYLL